MALFLEAEDAAGVPTRYHRVVSLTQVTNVQTTVEVASYASEEARRREGDSEFPSVYVSTVYYPFEYDEGMTVPGAYERLKTLDEFAGAEDA